MFINKNHINRSVFLIRELFCHITKKRRNQFIVIFILVIITSVFEVFSISLIMPFLAAITNPENFLISGPLKFFFAGHTKDSYTLLITVFFIMAILIASGFKLLTTWALTQIAVKTGSDLSVDIYKKTLNQPYKVHISRNTSEIIDVISNKTNNVIYTSMLPALNFLASLIVLFFILITLIVINPLIAFILLFGFGGSYFLVGFFVKKKLMLNSERMARESSNVIKLLQESLGAAREILLNGNQNIYCNAYLASDYPLRRAQGSNIFTGQSPRYILEAIGIILIAIVAYKLMGKSYSQTNLIPVIGFFAIGAQKLLPILQQIFSSWANIQGSEASLRDVLNLLNQPLKFEKKKLITAKIPFNSNIDIQNIFFRYSENMPWILRNLNINIKKGDHIGIIGHSGSGKSTLLDILVGLLDPDRGKIVVDKQTINETNKKMWQARIAYVSQEIFLIDGTIEENIAFGIPKYKINKNLIVNAAKKANFDHVVETLPHKYATIVGERGANLSGGQRQRIGIARAIYKKADLIIFDEATSALDSNSEKEILKTINNFDANVTIITISHRISLLKNCNKVYTLNLGKLIKVNLQNSI